MSNFITTAFVDEFKAGIEHLSQQKMSRLRQFVRIETVSAENASFDQLGATSMTKRTGRHVDTAYTDTPHERRWVTPEPYDVADLVDKPDRVRVLNDPTNEYTLSFAMAAGRTIDDVIIEATAAAASTGKTAATGTTAYDTSMDVLVGGAGLTVDKILEAKENLDANEEDDMGRVMVVSARQFRDLLSLVEVTSADFNTQRALMTGMVSGYLGFDFVRSERLLYTTATIRDCLYWQKSGMLLGEAESGSATIDRLPQKRNSISVLYQMDMGATRMRETGVGRVFCQE